MAKIRLDGDPTRLPRWWGGAHEPPRIAVWEITLACDLACRHCGSRAGPKRRNELSTAEALDVVAQLAEIGIREVTLIGGEAYLREDWADIAHAVTEAGMVCTMVTGANGFDAWRLQEALSAGVSHMSVSIDGVGLTHDTLRGVPGSFERAVDAARRIAATKQITLGINTQINRLSMPELSQLAHLVVELGAAAWQIQLTVALGRAADRPDLLLQPYHLLDLFPLLVAIKQQILEPSGVALAPGNNIGYFGPYEPELRYGGERGHRWSGCSAGRAAIGLEADGKIKGCPSLPSKSYTGGNIRDRAIADVLRNSHEITHLGQRTVEDLWGFCRSCDHAAECLAGCTWTSHALFGRPGNNPYCHHRALVFARQGLRERVHLIEAAPGQPFDHGRFDLVVEPLDSYPADPDFADQIGDLAWAVHLLKANVSRTGVWNDDSLRRICRKTKPRVEASIKEGTADV